MTQVNDDHREKVSNEPSSLVNFATFSGPLYVSAILIALLQYMSVQQLSVRLKEENERKQEGPEKRKILELIQHLGIHTILHHLPVGITANSTVKADEF